MQKRNKWKYPKRNLQVNDVVIIRENSPRCQWPLAIVEKTLPSSDGLVRKVLLHLKPTETGLKRLFERAVHDTVLLVPAGN